MGFFPFVHPIAYDLFEVLVDAAQVRLGP